MSDFEIHPGDEVTWNDPDNGTCSRTGVVESVEFHENGIVELTMNDGWTVEAFVHELS